MEEKKWWQSLTLWGTAILALCGVILPVIGQADLGSFLGAEKTNIMDVLTALGSVIGSVMAIIGRWRAKTRITT